MKTTTTTTITTALAALATTTALLGAGAITASPARAYGQQCWYETYYFVKNYGGCIPMAYDNYGRIIHLCCR